MLTLVLLGTSALAQAQAPTHSKRPHLRTPPAPTRRCCAPTGRFASPAEATVAGTLEALLRSTERRGSHVVRRDWKAIFDSMAPRDGHQLGYGELRDAIAQIVGGSSDGVASASATIDASAADLHESVEEVLDAAVSRGPSSSDW